MKYEVALPAMPKGRVEFETNGPGCTGLIGCILEHDGEYIQCVCANWPFPKFAFSRRFADSEYKDHPAAVWKVVNCPTSPSYTDGLFLEDEPITLPLVAP